ncbi:sn-glycerol-3-phosphate transport system permease protein UgpA [Clostridium sp. C105KSO15]|nr:sugar ABC transporter permease [uncultured Clostridium sp.]CUX43547.1 sn-glycerol-3-phosphate transport system permease protein UgpA [Clostridium sp. C105KSO15]
MKEKAIKRSYFKTQTGDRVFAFALLLPAIITTVAFILIPVADSIYRSFFDYKVKNIISGKPGIWNDFANYTKLFSNGKLLPSITNTLVFVFGVVTVQFILGMALALILNSDIRFSRFIRSIMMVPWVVPTLISGLIWLWLFQPQYGLVKYFVGILTGGRVMEFAILNNPATAMFGVSTAALWKQIPLAALLLLAGLANVPEDILEAAKIDGANGVQRFFNIVLPYMKSVIKVTVSMSIIENFKQFPLFWTMTGGGPNNSTTTMAILSYREAFVSNNFGSGAAVTTVWMLLMIVVVFVYNRMFQADDM